MDHLIFEETQSPLYTSNDGRLVFDHSVGPVNTFVVFLDGVEIFATRYRFAVDCYIAGYDAARSHHYVDGKGVEDEALGQKALGEMGVYEQRDALVTKALGIGPGETLRIEIDE